MGEITNAQAEREKSDITNKSNRSSKPQRERIREKENEIKEDIERRESMGEITHAQAEREKRDITNKSNRSPDNYEKKLDEKMKERNITEKPLSGDNYEKKLDEKMKERNIKERPLSPDNYEKKLDEIIKDRNIKEKSVSNGKYEDMLDDKISKSGIQEHIIEDDEKKLRKNIEDRLKTGEITQQRADKENKVFEVKGKIPIDDYESLIKGKLNKNDADESENITRDHRNEDKENELNVLKDEVKLETSKEEKKEVDLLKNKILDDLIEEKENDIKNEIRKKIRDKNITPEEIKEYRELFEKRGNISDDDYEQLLDDEFKNLGIEENIEELNNNRDDLIDSLNNYENQIGQKIKENEMVGNDVNRESELYNNIIKNKKSMNYREYKQILDALINRFNLKKDIRNEKMILLTQKLEENRAEVDKLIKAKIKLQRRIKENELNELESKKREQAKILKLIDTITNAIDVKMDLHKKVLESYESHIKNDDKLKKLKSLM